MFLLAPISNFQPQTEVTALTTDSMNEFKISKAVKIF